jgi:hypothetical protein
VNFIVGIPFNLLCKFAAETTLMPVDGTIGDLCGDLVEYIDRFIDNRCPEGIDNRYELSSGLNLQMPRNLPRNQFSIY